jgi:hypothetical protein
VEQQERELSEAKESLAAASAAKKAAEAKHKTLLQKEQSLRKEREVGSVGSPVSPPCWLTAPRHT